MAARARASNWRVRGKVAGVQQTFPPLITEAQTAVKQLQMMHAVRQKAAK